MWRACADEAVTKALSFKGDYLINWLHTNCYKGLKFMLTLRRQKLKGRMSQG
jgi:hypothetical protein